MLVIWLVFNAELIIDSSSILSSTVLTSFSSILFTCTQRYLTQLTQIRLVSVSLAMHTLVCAHTHTHAQTTKKTPKQIIIILDNNIGGSSLHIRHLSKYKIFVFVQNCIAYNVWWRSSTHKQEIIIIVVVVSVFSSL